MRCVNSLLIVATLLLACANRSQPEQGEKACEAPVPPASVLASLDERMLEPEALLPGYDGAWRIVWVTGPNGQKDGIVATRWGTSPSHPTDYLGRNERGTWDLVTSAPWLQSTAAVAGRFTSDGSELVLFGEPDENRLALGRPADLADRDKFHFVPLPGRPAYLHVADVDGDGVDDAVVVVYVGEYPRGSSLVMILAAVGDGTLIERERLPLGAGSWDISLGDINSDGLIDMVASNRDRPSVDILLAVGPGNFERTSTIGITTPSGSGGEPLRASGTALRDLNGDGHLDLVVAGRSDTLGILYFEGDGSGGFAPPLEVPSPSTGFIMFRENGDSTQLITIDRGSRGMIVIHTPLTSTPRITEFHPASGLLGRMFVDVDGDGLSDILMGSVDPSTPGLRLLRGSGSTFEGFRTFPQPGGAARGVVLDDSGDQVTLAIAAMEGNAILIGTLDEEGFVIQQEIPDIPRPRALAAVDLNLDGRLDFIVGSVENDVSAYLRLEDGSFRRSQILEDVAWDFAVGDFDGDCKDDIAVALTDTREIAVIHSRPMDDGWPISRTPVDGDPGSLLAHDLDGDGDKDLIVALFWSGRVIRLDNQGKDGLSGMDTLATIETPHGLSICDMDGDGRDEIAVGSFNRQSVSIVGADGSVSEFPAGGRIFSAGQVTAPSGCGAITFDREGGFHSVDWSPEANGPRIKSWPYVVGYLGASSQVITTSRSVITLFPETSRIGYLPALPGQPKQE